MPNIGTFPDVAPKQKQTFAIDFGNFLPPGISLEGTPTIYMSVAYGRDPSPDSRVTGGPAVATANPVIGGTGITNAAILFQIGDCIAGVNYIIEVVCDRTDDDIAEAWATFRCVGPGGR